MRRVTSSNSLAWFQWLIGTIVNSGPAGDRTGTVPCGGTNWLNAMIVNRPSDMTNGFKPFWHRVTFPVDSGAKPILLSATMKTALILVVGKRVGKAV
ncbi:hypothetical protein [Mesorhizobium sp.]|uniref:hypothetical protein n=1 Tax=Mesorhizobium sp. TaxID=1871066 RepID=UPI001222163D|nr:hypothetical protein [Mesorhizobium sp.]TIM84937.1 MAG: hypothetical protein E5Y50_20390 [Mesorhizobium sp.]